MLPEIQYSSVITLIQRKNCMLYQQLLLASIVCIATSSIDAAPSLLESVINLEHELITTMTTAPANATYKSFTERCDALLATINKTHNHAFVTLYHNLLSELAHHYNLDDTRPSTIITHLIDYHQLPQSPAIKTLFTLRCVYVLLPHLLNPPKNTLPLNTITRQAIKQLEQLTERIYKALQLKQRQSWLKNRYLLTLLTGVTISIVIYLGYKTYTELKRLKEDETARLNALNALTETLKTAQAQTIRQQELIAAGTNSQELLTQRVTTLQETVEALNTSHVNKSDTFFSAQTLLTQRTDELNRAFTKHIDNTSRALQELAHRVELQKHESTSALNEQSARLTTEQTTAFNEISTRLDTQRNDYTSSLQAQSAAFAATQATTITAFNELVGTIKQQNRQFTDSLKYITSVVSESIEADRALSEREESSIGSFLDGMTLNLNDVTKAIGAVGSIVVAADRISSITQDRQATTTRISESDLLERLRNL